MPLWKVFGANLLTFGFFGGMLALYPFHSYSPVALAVGAGLGVLGVVVGVRTSRTQDWWGQVAYLCILHLLFLGLAVRAWADVIPGIWFWLIFMLSLYLLAWALPVLHPKIAEFLWREQFAPETRLGRGCMAVSLALLPVIGGLAGVFGGLGVEKMSDKSVSLVMAILFSLVAIGWGQSSAHAMWPTRPWAETNQHHQSGDT